MSKIKIHVYLSQDNNILIDDSLSAVFNNNVIKYDDGVINMFDLDKLVLERICDDYSLILNFIDCTALYKSFESSLLMHLEVFNKVVDSNSVFIRYKVIESNLLCEYKISWSV